MGFNKKEVNKLLASCHRRCCICHKFCGVKMETDHIEQKFISQNDSIENAIPVCFECHAEIHLYNDKHPRGRKFSSEELHEHKRQWLEICEKNPEMFIQPLQRSDVGPLQSLADELKFNVAIKQYQDSNVGYFCPFEVKQFDRSLNDGYISILNDSLADSLTNTYIQIKLANTALNAITSAPCERDRGLAKNRLQDVLRIMGTKIDETYKLLKNQLE